MFLTHCLLEVEHNFLPLLCELIKGFTVLCAAQMPLRVIIPSKFRGFRSWRPDLNPSPETAFGFKETAFLK